MITSSLTIPRKYHLYIENGNCRTLTVRFLNSKDEEFYIFTITKCCNKTGCIWNIGKSADFLKIENVKSIITSTYDDAMKTKVLIENIVTEKQHIKDEWNKHFKGIYKNLMDATDLWSNIPEDDVASLLKNPDAILSVPGIISKNEYVCETHTVISQGYVLNVHRIPHSKFNDSLPSKTVLLQHAMFGSSAAWIVRGSEKGLAYILADAGYDVWMTNIRGNRYSKEHVMLESNSKRYWNFSWHDVALYDDPEIINYILKTKGEGTRITYIGYSMGATILFAMLGMRPEYNNILTAGFAVAPIVFASDMKSPLKLLAPIASDFAYLNMLQGSYEFMSENSIIAKIANVCKEEGQNNIYSEICKNFMFVLCGFSEKQYNSTLVSKFLSHMGTGTSWKTVVHFPQEINSGGKFQYFDYGPISNMKIYGTSSPPAYDLSKVTLPIKLFWSKNDLVVTQKDVLALKEILPSKPEMFLVPDSEFNHLDYLWAVDAPTLLTDEIVKSVNSYMNN